MNRIRLAAAALLATITDAVLDFFGHTVDGAIAALTAAEAKLARVEARAERRLTNIAGQIEASRARYVAAFERELAVRDGLYAAEDNVRDARARAARIRQRISKLVD